MAMGLHVGTERGQRGKNRQQQRHVGAADEVQHLVQVRAGRRERVCPTAKEDQRDGEQDRGGRSNCACGCGKRFVCAAAFRNRVRHGQKNGRGFFQRRRTGGVVFAGPETREKPAQNRSCHHPRGQSDQQAEQDGAAHIRVVLHDGQHGGGMGRQRAVHDGETGEERNADENGWLAAAARGRGHDGHHEHEANLKEDRQAYEEPQTQQGPGKTALAAAFDEGIAEGGGAARCCEQLAEDGAEAEDDGDMPHEAAHAVGEGDRHLRERHARGDTQAQRRNHKAERGMQTKPRDERHESDNRSGGADQQVPTWRGYKDCEGHGGIIP